MKIIKVVIDASGAPPTVEGVGFQGKECLAATLDFVKAFGGAKSEQKKPEFHQAAPQKVRQ